MSFLGDRHTAGFFPLQDFAAARDNVSVGRKLCLAGLRVEQVSDLGTETDPQNVPIQWSEVNSLGTIGDLHPWLFLQTRDRGERAAGAWMQAFGGMISTPGGRYEFPSALPFERSSLKVDERFDPVEVASTGCLPQKVRGQIVAVFPGTRDDQQDAIALHADPRLFAPTTSAPGAAGTLVVDLQPDGELCMDGSPTEEPGRTGRAARLQAFLKVVARRGREFNTLAWNFADSQQEGIPNFGMVFGRLEASSQGGGPTTGGPGDVVPGPTTGPTTGGTGGGPGGTGGGSGAASVVAGFSAGRSTGASGSFGSSRVLAATAADEELDVCGTGSFSPVNRANHGLAVLAASGGSGPIHLGNVRDKHQITTDADSHPINSAHVSTNAYFYRSEFEDGPLLFEGDYPTAIPFPIPAQTHLSWDPMPSHAFQGGSRQGVWRWWTGLPDFMPQPPSDPGGGNQPPTGDPSGPTTGGPGNPGPGGPGNPGGPGGGGPTTGGGGPAGGGPGTGGSGPVGGGGGGPTTGGSLPAGSGPSGPGGSPGGRPGGPTTGGDGGPADFGGLSGPPGGPGSGNGDPNPPPPVGPTTTGTLDPTLPPGVIPFDPFDYNGDGVVDLQDERDFERDQEDRNRARQGARDAVNSTVGSGKVNGPGGQFEVFRPFASSFPSISFRPQLTIAGYPDVSHNPNTSLASIRAEDETRPSVLSLLAYGDQNTDGDWDRIDEPEDCGPRGGTANGGVLFAPPNRQLADYLGETDVTTETLDADFTDTATPTSFVTAAPSVGFALGQPNRNGRLRASSIGLLRDTSDSTGTNPLFVYQVNNAGSAQELIRGSVEGPVGGEVLVCIGGGGTTGIQIPTGTTAERPSFFTPAAGMLRINSDLVSGKDCFEYFDSQAATWRQMPTGSGGGGAMTFLDLTDTPASYAGLTAGDVVQFDGSDLDFETPVATSGTAGALIRLDGSGDLDSSFGSTWNASALADIPTRGSASTVLIVNSGGTAYEARATVTSSGTANALVRLDGSGDLDSSFGSTWTVDDLNETTVTVPGTAGALIRTDGAGDLDSSFFGSIDFTDLGDTPATILANQIIAGNSGGTALVNSGVSIGGGLVNLNSAFSLGGAISVLLADNAPLVLGTGFDSSITHNGTNLIVTPDLVGSGVFLINGTQRFNDNEVLEFGTSGDCPITWNGVSLVIDPDAVTPGGSVEINGDLIVKTLVNLEDSAQLELGTGSDATIEFDGTDLIINPQAVGTGELEIAAGALRMPDSVPLKLGSSSDATIEYDGSDLVVNPRAVGSGYLKVSSGGVELPDNVRILFGTGSDMSLGYDGTDLAVVTNTSGRFVTDGLISAGTGFDVAGANGLTQVVNFKDGVGTTHTMTFTGGILTGYTAV